MGKMGRGHLGMPEKCADASLHFINLFFNFLSVTTNSSIMQSNGAFVTLQKD